jgi:predicted kinase
LDEVIAEQRERIERLIAEDRLREASSALTTLGAAIEQIGERLAARAAEYYAEAELINRRADVGDDQRRLQETATQQEPLAFPPAASDDRDTPLIFVNPF